MKRRQTKKNFKKALAETKAKTKVTVQEAWDIVGDHLIETGNAVCAFVRKNYENGTVVLHTAGDTFILESTPRREADRID